MKPFEPDDSASPGPPSSVRGSERDRAARLAAIRAMIDEGTYETTERLEAAVSRMLIDVGEF